MMISKKFKLTSIALLSTVALAACSTGSSDGSSAVATGDGVEVTNEELQAELKSTYGNTVLQKLIMEEVFVNEVGDDRAKELKEEATTEVETLIATYGGEDEFNTVLASSGFSDREDYEHQVYYYKLMSESVSKYIEVTDEEIQTAYDDYTPSFTVSHILVDDEETAKDLIAQLDDGADFAELAKENSTDTSSAKNGGSLGEVNADSGLDETFFAAAQELAEGEYTTAPVETDYGYHIIKMDEKPEKGSLEDETEQLKESIVAEKLTDSTLVAGIVSDIMTAHNIDIKDDDLKTALDDVIITEEEQESLDAEAESAAAASESAASESAASSEESSESSSEESTSEESSTEESSTESSSTESSESSEAASSEASSSAE
ncbi:Foldase protein prsA precursor [Aerococcus viridans]|uniref:Foldase protein PrsA n=2 Tax=Aerococcus viridans TaxID=1377 RepID=A0AAU8U3V9_9LACT|nr:peptidylprolyl isomerase [Aerococcus viridans]AMC00597.1 peptidylprolyl isomerase [Aerococcus viridans]EFG50258.1 PPIC-type PPIASE domain protein [Aerococcus viridans ATCC 11563 = CCUG 4311]SUU07414.1 Foldase protein prsA precursor [Aerococcus viridans]